MGEIGRGGIILIREIAANRSPTKELQLLQPLLGINTIFRMMNAASNSQQCRNLFARVEAQHLRTNETKVDS